MVQNSVLLFIDGGGQEVQAPAGDSNPTQNTSISVDAGTGDFAEEAPRQQQGGSPWTMIIMMVLIFAVFYFFMIRPQRKQQKELQKKREAMKKGDKVVTAGGIFGEIKEVQEHTFLITISKDVTIKVNKESVYADLTDASQAAASEKK